MKLIALHHRVWIASIVLALGVASARAQETPQGANAAPRGPSGQIAPAAQKQAGDAKPAVTTEVPAEAKAIARRAISADEKDAATAIAQLRAMGPGGLDALLSIEPEGLAAWRGGDTAAARRAALPGPLPGVDSTSGTKEAAAQAELVKRYLAAVDAVAGQRDATVSRLYWHTDLSAAKAAAAQQGKPILSLRMLGNLTDELSCANSRFFRTALYGNQEIAGYLRQSFVLHWESVRPVPKITIDFGDGRKLERTITGNSVHYILDSRGRVVDLLPGLYGPQAFLREIKAAEQLALRLPGRESTVIGIVGTLQNHHRSAANQAMEAWKADLSKALGSEVALAGDAEANFTTLAGKTGDQAWQAIAAMHRDEAKLDRAGHGMIARERHGAWEAGRMAIGAKRAAEDPMLRVVRNFEANMALDTVRNQYLLRTQAHLWLAKDSRLAENLSKLNDRVYADLFLTPRSDPWLGLASEDEYSGLTNDGKVTRAERR